MTDIQKEIQRLEQQSFIDWIKKDIPVSQMQTVYKYGEKGWGNYCIYCALIPNSKVQEVLQDSSWDFHMDQGEPGSIIYGSASGQERVAYLRYGTDNGMEPLIIHRSFHGVKPSYVEISEEFRHFHSLYHDKKTNKYISIDDAGNDHVIIYDNPDCLQIRLKEIKQFLAIKEMHLAIFFDCRMDSVLLLSELGLSKGCQDYNEGSLRYSRSYGEFMLYRDTKSFCRIWGKKIISGFTKEKSGFWGFAEEKPEQHIDFIIGVDEHGENFMYSSDPDGLSNRIFDKNPTTPDYLTPVFFKKAVLDKYYQQPDKYSVEDGYLRFCGLWGVTMDNHHADKVIMWLGDLGRDLPYEEKLHWKSFNIQPIGGVSSTFFKRQILAQSTDTDQPDILFKHEYAELTKYSQKILGWPLLLPLAPEDQHYFQSLRIASDSDQKAFDEIIQGLTKTLIDSINEKQLKKLIPKDKRGEIKGSISRLEYVLQDAEVGDYEIHIQFLRDLQELRSSGSAHRKGSKYQEVVTRLGLVDTPFSEFSKCLFEKAKEYFGYLKSVIDAISSKVKNVRVN